MIGVGDPSCFRSQRLLGKVVEGTEVVCWPCMQGEDGTVVLERGCEGVLDSELVEVER